MQSKSVAVFCSAQDEVSDYHKTTAEDLGRSLAEKGFCLVTGGSNTGLMKEVVDGYRKVKPKEDGIVNIKGVIPTVLRQYNIIHDEIDQFHWTDGMGKRLEVFHKISDSIVVLPGGFGTMHELLDFLVSNQFGISKEKIILYNADGFWDNFIAQLDKMVENKTLNPKHRALLNLTDNLNQIIDILGEGKVQEAGLNDRYWEKKLQAGAASAAPSSVTTDMIGPQ